MKILGFDTEVIGLLFKGKKAASAIEKEITVNHEWKKSFKAAGLDLLLTSLAVLLAYFADPVNLGLALNSLSPEVKAALIPIISAVLVLLRKYVKHATPPNAGPDVKSGALGGALILLALLPSTAIAQEPKPEPKVTFKLSSGATRFFTPGIGDVTEIEGQVTLTVKAPSEIVIEGFGRFTRQQGVEPGLAGYLDVDTYRAIVADFEVRRPLGPRFMGVSFLHAACSSGVSWARDKAFDPTDPNIWAIGCGVASYIPQGSLSVKVGHDGGVGGFAVFGKLVIPQGERARYVATYAIPFNAERFRKNPGRWTLGVQFDMWERGL